jgi:hypothetical protein
MRFVEPAPPLTDQCCGNCLFRRGTDCREDSPVIDRSWPMVLMEDWCGKWQQMPEVKLPTLK